MICDITGRTWAEDNSEQGAKENIWTSREEAVSL